MEQENDRANAGATALHLAPSLVAMAWLIWQAQWFWGRVPELRFGWVAVGLCGVLFWMALVRRPPVDWRMRWWAAMAMLAGGGLLGLVQIYQASMGTNAASTAGLALGVMLVAIANLGIVFGWRGVSGFGMAYALLLLAMPMPSAVRGPLMAMVHGVTGTVNLEVLNLLGIPAIRAGRSFELPGGTVDMATLATGITSLQASLTAVVFIAWMTTRRWSGRAMLLVLGGGLLAVANIGCSLWLALAADKYGVDEVGRLGGIAPWVVLGVVVAGVGGVAWIVRRRGCRS